MGTDKFHFEEATIADVHKAFLSGRLTAIQLVRYYQKRIDTYNQSGPRLNAIIRVNPKAKELAVALDTKLKKSGLAEPLHGIPVILKDNVSTMDKPTTAGSLLLKEYMPPYDPSLRKG